MSRRFDIGWLDLVAGATSRVWQPPAPVLRSGALLVALQWMATAGPQRAMGQVDSAALPVASAAEASDVLLGAGDAAGAYALLRARLEAHPDDFEAGWRAVRIALGQAVVGDSHGERAGWAHQADSVGRALLEARPDDPDALAWAAAARGRRALNEEGMRLPASLASEAWSLTERLMRQAPDHALGNHVRGKLCQQVARLPRVARWFGRIAVGSGLMSQGTWECAETHHLKAVEADPGMIFFYLDLGDTFAAQGKEDEAVEAWEKGIGMPEQYPWDAGLTALLSRRLEALQPPGPEESPIPLSQRVEPDAGLPLPGPCDDRVMPR